MNIIKQTAKETEWLEFAIVFKINKNIYFASDSWSVSQRFSNNTKMVNHGRRTEQMLDDTHSQHREMPNTETAHQL